MPISLTFPENKLIILIESCKVSNLFFPKFNDSYVGGYHPKAFADFAAASSSACLGSLTPK